MEKPDINDILKLISSKEKKDSYDYEGYGVIENLKMSRKELRDAIDIMWEICMELDKDQRDKKYLFGKGIIESKDVFLKQYKTGKSLDQSKVNAFKHKLENVKPLVEVLIKLKEVI